MGIVDKAWDLDNTQELQPTLSEGGPIRLGAAVAPQRVDQLARV